MGVYCYTRRNDVKKIDDVEVVRFGFAYKDVMWSTPEISRKVAIMHGHAERSTDKTAHVQYGIMGDWKYVSDNNDVHIFEIDRNVECFMDNRIPKSVGYLKKKGRSYYIIWNKD